MSTETTAIRSESDTLGDVTAAETSTPTATGYGGLWRRVPRELGFLLLTLPIGVAGLAILQGTFWPGVGTSPIYVGVFLVLASLYIARGFGTLQRVRLRWAGRPEIAAPQWEPRDKPSGFLRRTFGPFVNGHYWLYLLHGMFINPVVSIFTWVITIVWLAVGLGGISYWFWDRFPPNTDGHFLSTVVYEAVFPGNTATFDPVTGDNVLMLIAGVLCLATLPFVTRGLTLLNDVIARGMLGAWRYEALQREVADLSASRGAAVVAEDRSLRRLERDIHDGPQQRLVRLQMDLASAERKLDADPAAARSLLEEARGQARDTLEELRALSRGFAPPILEDRGLASGLESLAARSTVPVQLESSLETDRRLPSEIERSAYYVVAELLTNVAKHSGATKARLYAALRIEADTTWLDIWVTDNGAGGASLVDGHGLRGLDERLRGLRGVLVVESPAGGPTQIGAHIPVTGIAEGPLPLS